MDLAAPQCETTADVAEPGWLRRWWFPIAMAVSMIAIIALPVRLGGDNFAVAANTYWLNTNTDFPRGFTSFSTTDARGVVSWYASIRIGKLARSFFVSINRGERSRPQPPDRHDD